MFAFPRKSADFLTSFSACRKRGTGSFAVCGQRPGLLALDLASIFEKIAGAKNSIDAITCGFRVINSFCQKMCSDRFAVKIKQQRPMYSFDLVIPSVGTTKWTFHPFHLHAYCFLSALLAKSLCSEIRNGSDLSLFPKFETG